jgi:hypothetical protein
MIAEKRIFGFGVGVFIPLYTRIHILYTRILPYAHEKAQLGLEMDKFLHPPRGEYTQGTVKTCIALESHLHVLSDKYFLNIM